MGECGRGGRTWPSLQAAALQGKVIFSLWAECLCAVGLGAAGIEPFYIVPFKKLLLIRLSVLFLCVRIWAKLLFSISPTHRSGPNAHTMSLLV